MKSGEARVAMIGFPSVGKSTLLSKITKTESVAASYEFTTLTCIPGVIEVSFHTQVLGVKLAAVVVAVACALPFSINKQAKSYICYWRVIDVSHHQHQ